MKKERRNERKKKGKKASNKERKRTSSHPQLCPVFDPRPSPLPPPPPPCPRPAVCHLITDRVRPPKNKDTKKLKKKFYYHEVRKRPSQFYIRLLFFINRYIKKKCLILSYLTIIGQFSVMPETLLYVFGSCERRSEEMHILWRPMPPKEDSLRC